MAKSRYTGWIVLAAAILFGIIWFAVSCAPSMNNGQYGPDADNERLLDATGGKDCRADRPLLVIDIESPTQQAGHIVCTKKGGNHWFAALYTESDSSNSENEQTWQNIQEIDPADFTLNYHPRYDAQLKQRVQILTANDDGYANVTASGGRLTQQVMNEGGIVQIVNSCWHSFLTRVANEGPCSR